MALDSKIKSTLICLILILLNVQIFAQEQSMSKDRLIGSILKNALETYHYTKMKIDDDVSEKAFEEFLKKIDFGKQFLLESDVKNLEKFRFKLDDQIVNGDHSAIKEVEEILKKSIKETEKYRDEFFKQGFDFSQKETLQLDPEKRTWLKTEEERKELWRKIFKQATLSRYLDLWQEQLDLKDPKKQKEKREADKKAKKKTAEVKQLTKKETLAKATEAISDKYKKVFDRLNEDDRDDFMDKLFNSITEIFDPHTTYLPPKKKEDFDIDISGSLEGIGAVLQEDGSYIKVVQIVPGGAAWRQKDLEVEDLILMVGQGEDEPVSLVDMRVDDAVRYIRGPKGSTVTLTVKKVDGTRKVIKIERDVVKISASYVKSSIIEHKDLGQKIGYIHVPKFYRDFNGDGRNCSDDVKNELERLQKLGVDGIILDLRNNGGGALEDARIMSGLFIEEGPIVQIRNHKGEVDVLSDFDKAIQYNGPLIVMTNRFSASASEILAAALQDYGRAVIVGGEYSHGKGTVQAVLNLNQAPLLNMFGPTIGALKVTIQKFYRVNGSSTQYKGVTPDLIIPDPMGYAKNREQDLDYSLKWDQVKQLSYKKWSLYDLNLDDLKKKSQERSKNNERFKHIEDSIAYLTKRRDETVVSLNEVDAQQEEEKAKKMTEKFKLDEEQKKMIISHYKDSLDEGQDKIQEADRKKWEEDSQLRIDDWAKMVRLDAGLEESLFIMNDMIKNMKSKVSMKK